MKNNSGVRNAGDLEMFAFRSRLILWKSMIMGFFSVMYSSLRLSLIFLSLKLSVDSKTFLSPKSRFKNYITTVPRAPPATSLWNFISYNRAVAPG